MRENARGAEIVEREESLAVRPSKRLERPPPKLKVLG